MTDAPRGANPLRTVDPLESSLELASSDIAGPEYWIESLRAYGEVGLGNILSQSDAMVRDLATRLQGQQAWDFLAAYPYGLTKMVKEGKASPITVGRKINRLVIAHPAVFITSVGLKMMKRRPSSTPSTRTTSILRARDLLSRCDAYLKSNKDADHMWAIYLEHFGVPLAGMKGEYRPSKVKKAQLRVMASSEDGASGSGHMLEKQATDPVSVDEDRGGGTTGSAEGGDAEPEGPLKKKKKKQRTGKSSGRGNRAAEDIDDQDQGIPLDAFGLDVISAMSGHSGPIRFCDLPICEPRKRRGKKHSKKRKREEDNLEDDDDNAGTESLDPEGDATRDFLAG